MMTSLHDIDLRRRLSAQRTAVAVMLGVTCVGFVDDLAFFVITLHAIIWTTLLIGKTATLHELAMSVPEPHQEVLMKK